ncbi:HD-GYP domain-containing protein [Knoellia subterranea]|uniref:HD/PDEase domain-containing protein n=1 Tax=Knoellia subterranea KCTC 19937 TaxID=1385521 RepID=A0A0A0JVF7_9MICO|nr:HD domain-containing phosphohydrolase [Knoellia subterranea]KGN39616.1 hypothetical protein N803_02505 [Knoellia subterranea KCTC 19937]
MSRRALSPRFTKHGTPLYIAGVVVLAVGLALLCHRRYGLPENWWALGILALLGALTWWLPATSSDGRVHFTADNVVILAAIPIIGPLGTGLVSLIMAATTRRSMALQRRIFNTAAVSASTMLSAVAYDLAQGSFEAASLKGPLELMWHVGAPIVVADLVLLVTNAVLVAIVIRLSAGVPVRLQVVDMLTSSGLTQFAYGIIAFLVVVMWLPGQLGAVSVLVALAPLAGARWALLQYGDERAARERALGALVTAIETREPALEGHSERVSVLAARMAQDLGLGPMVVADVRTAGLLHDLGRVAVAPRQRDEAPGAFAPRGAAMLQGLPFLAGATAVMEGALRVGSGDEVSIASEIVRAADEYDLLLHGDEDVDAAAALDSLRSTLHGESGGRVLAALTRAVRVQDGYDAGGSFAP